MITKVIGILIMIAAVSIALLTLKGEDGFFCKQQKSCVQLTPAQQLSQLIERDFEQLVKDKSLPQQWSTIRSTEVRMNSQLAKTLLGKTLPEVPAHKVAEGDHYLELEIVDLPDDENPGLIVQASLFNIKTKNKIYEIGRSYTMKDLNHDKSVEENLNDVKKEQKTSSRK